jgi:hypothetical protein
MLYNAACKRVVEFESLSVLELESFGAELLLFFLF